jgi:hypothetical protein
MKQEETVWCDWGHECREARVLPIGGGGNLILCFTHFRREMSARRFEDKVLWNKLEKYDPCD